MSKDKFGLIGKTLYEAAGLIPAEDYSYRVVKRDGFARVCTRDFDDHRVNLEIVGGLIVGYTFG